LNAVLPAGVLGDVHRAVSHGRRSGHLERGVRAVVLERVAGQAVLVLATAALLFTLPTALLGTGLRAIAISVGVVISALVVGTVGLRFGRAVAPAGGGRCTRWLRTYVSGSSRVAPRWWCCRWWHWPETCVCSSLRLRRRGWMHRCLPSFPWRWWLCWR